MTLNAFINRWRNWWRIQLRDALELVLVPALAIFLPWPICFSLFKGLARLPVLYRIPVRRGLEQAAQRGWMATAESARWARDLRLVRLIDHADFYLMATRGTTWMKRYVQVDGHWPEPGQAGLLCTFHWGAGMWALRHAREQGLRLHMLLARFDPGVFAGHPVMLNYGRWRTDAVAREGGCPTIDPTQAGAPLRAALASREHVMAAMDVPSDMVKSTEVVDFLGHRVSMPSGLVRLAFEQQVPVTLFSMGINLETGQRHLRIRTLPPASDSSQLMKQVFAEMDALVRQSPTHWHFWGEAERIFAAPAPRS